MASLISTPFTMPATKAASTTPMIASRLPTARHRMAAVTIQNMAV
jgi:hypothetical protein